MLCNALHAAAPAAAAKQVRTMRPLPTLCMQATVASATLAPAPQGSQATVASVPLLVREVPDPPYQPMLVWRRVDHGRRRPRDRYKGRRSLAAARRRLRVGYAAAAGDAFVRPSGFFARPSLHSAAADRDRVRWPCRPGFGFCKTTVMVVRASADRPRDREPGRRVRGSRVL